MKMVCVCGHLIEDQNDLLLHALSHALAYRLQLTADERDLVTRYMA